jgi:hypothetical protein
MSEKRGCACDSMVEGQPCDGCQEKERSLPWPALRRVLAVPVQAVCAVATIALLIAGVLYYAARGVVMRLLR